jgi:predicted acetyltransferase
VRLVDLPVALAARRYGAADALVLEVADAFCPWNAGRWRLATAGEAGAAVATVERTDAPADLVVDVADLGAAYLGTFGLSDLAAAGRVEERTPGALRRADALFAADRAAWCATMF